MKTMLIRFEIFAFFFWQFKRLHCLEEDGPSAGQNENIAELWFEEEVGFGLRPTTNASDADRHGPQCLPGKVGHLFG